MSNKYYEWWKSNKPLMALFPAIVFWFSSMMFFMVGLRFDNSLLILGWNASTTVAILLTLANTFIQIIGNEMEPEGMGTALWIGWIASYALGIGTNIVGLRMVLAIDNVNLEWLIACGLGTLIEVMPERLLVLFLKTWSGLEKKPKSSPKPFYRPGSPVMKNIPQNTPSPWRGSRPNPKSKSKNFPTPTYHPVSELKPPFEE